MDIEAAGIGDQVNKTELDRRHDGEEEKDGLEKFLTVSLWIFDRAELLFDRAGMEERVFDNQLTEVQRGAERKLSDGRGMNGACVDRTSDPSGFGNKVSKSVSSGHRPSYRR